MKDLWEQLEPTFYLTLILAFAATADLNTYLPAKVGAWGMATVFGVHLGSYLHRTRWSGKPVILITAEAAQAVMSGKFNLKTPEKERLH